MGLGEQVFIPQDGESLYCQLSVAIAIAIE